MYRNFALGIPSLDHTQTPIHSLLEFRGYFFVFKSLAYVTVSNIKSPNFRHLLTFTCSFYFWRLQSANVGFSIASTREPSKWSIDQLYCPYLIISEVRHALRFVCPWIPHNWITNVVNSKISTQYKWGEKLISFTLSSVIQKLDNTGYNDIVLLIVSVASLVAGVGL